jgi:hypothetical protein
MHLNKTSGNISGETAPETSAQKAASANAVVKAVAQSVKSAASAVPKTPPSSAPQAAARSVSSMISAAGLPVDKLSASIISFARFFSLPLKPELLKNIRQQAFTMTTNATSPNPTPAAESEQNAQGVAKSEQGVQNAQEARALAAAAAEGKGVELQPKGLEAYAQAVDPEWRKRQDSGQRDQRGRGNKNDNEKEETPLQKTAAITAGSLEKTALEWAGKNPLLAILNRLPEKDGKRWIVLPLDFSDNGIEYKVSLRILLETGKTVSRAGCMALDIASHSTVENGKTEKRRLFVLEPANRLSVYLQPEITPAQQVSLVRELSALLEIAPERIFVKTQTESFPFEADCGNDFLRSIDEAV